MLLGLPPDAKWHRIVTPSFEIDYPPWIYEMQGDGFAGGPIDGQGMISISASNVPGPLDRPPNIRAIFKSETPVSDCQKGKHPTLDVWQQELEYRALWGLLGVYRNIVVAAYKEPTLVLCQFRDSRRRLPQWSSHVIGRMIDSLAITTKT